MNLRGEPNFSKQKYLFHWKNESTVPTLTISFSINNVSLQIMYLDVFYWSGRIDGIQF